MAGFEGMTLTKLGQNLLAECMNGKNMKLSRVVVGSGSYTGNIEDIEDIIEKQLEIEIQNIKIEDEVSGQINVQTYFNNESLENAFYFREIALYAIDCETNIEVLYAYSNCGENAEYINAMSNETTNDYIEKYIDIVVKVGNIDNFNVTIKKFLKFNDLSDEELAEIKTNVTNYYKRYEKTYKTTVENESNIEINISQYNEGSILEVYVEGRILNKDEYTINGTNSITLTTPLSEKGTEVLFVVYRSVCATNEDYDALKGDKGDSGAIVFDSVADMKANTSLQAGDTCQTLGYYSANDGGSGLYKIVDDETLEDDGGSVHHLNNGLKAKLIIENNIITPQQFGAYGDGEHDDTIYIQKAIDYSENICLEKNTFASGDPKIGLFNKYKVTSTIFFSPFLTYDILGDCFFVSYISENGTPCIHIKYRNNKVISGNNIVSSNWIRGDIIIGGCLHIANSVSFKEAVNNGLEIGNAEDGGTYTAISRGRIKNISITNFNKGLVLNANHLYIYEFDNLIIHSNISDCYTGEVAVDSGENISFNNCLFGTTDEYGIRILCPGLNVKFDNCSFDFNGSGAICMKGSTNLILNGCHIEGAQNSNEKLTSYIGIDPDADSSNSYKLNINSLKLVNSRKMLPLFIGGGNYSMVTVNGLNETTVNSATIVNYNNKENLYLFNNCKVTEQNGIETVYRLVSPRKNLFKINLEEEPDQTSITSDASKYFYHVWRNASTTKEEVIISIEGIKCIAYYPLTESSLFNATFGVREEIPVNYLNIDKKLQVGFEYLYTTGKVHCNVNLYCLDNEGNQLASLVHYDITLKSSEEWSKPGTVGFFNRDINNRVIPEGTKKIKVGLTFIADEYCDGFYVKNINANWM